MAEGERTAAAEEEGEGKKVGGGEGRVAQAAREVKEAAQGLVRKGEVRSRQYQPSTHVRQAGGRRGGLTSWWLQAVA